MAASNGLPRRRQRSNPLRDSPEADGQMELQETVRLRDRATKRDRDRDLVNRTKRRRGDRLMQGSSNRDDVEDSTDESFGRDEEDYEIEDGVSHALLTNTTSTSFAFFNQNHRKSLPPAKVVRQPPELKVTDEMIGVAVPRKARSASVKRSHESWVLGNGGCGEEQNHRRASASPPAGWSAETLSPSSSNVSVRKKMKSSGGPKTRFPKTPKSSSSGQEDIEIEIAEVLYGLMKQSQSSKKEDDSGNSLQNLESKDTIRVIHGTNPSGSAQMTPHALIVSQSSNRPASDPLLGAVTKNMKVEVEKSSSSGQKGSIALIVKAENDQTAKMETSSPKLVNSSEINLETNKACHDIGAVIAAPASLELQEEGIKNGDSKPSIEELGCSDVTLVEEKSMSPKGESTLCGKLDDNFQDSTMTKEISTVPEVETQREEKFKIDLMAPPPIVSSPERDGTTDFSSDLKHVPQDMEKKNEPLVKNEEVVERLGKQEAVHEEHENKKRKTTEQKCELLKLDLERLNQDSGRDRSSKLSQKQQLQSKTTIAKVEKTVQSSTVPLPMPVVAGWPSSIPHLGYMPSFQTVVPVDRSTGSSAVLQPPHFPVSQPRPKRCATHHYIACNIRIHQQLTKMNHFWSAAAAAGSASICGTKPNNLNVIPAGENVVLGNTLQGSFPVVNLNSAQDKGQAVVNLPGFSRKDKSSEGANFVDMTQKKQLIVSQAPQQAPVGNLPHGPPFVFPLSQQQQTGIVAVANQSGPSKTATSNNNASIPGSAATRAPANSAALPAVAATVSFNYPNLAANDAPYLTILQSNGYPFQISTPVGTPPTFRGGTPAQALPFFNGSFYSPQMLHPSQLQQQQPHSQPLVQSAYQNTRTPSVSSSSHKQPQAQHPRGAQVNSNGFLTSTSMPPQKHHQSHQSRKLEAEMSEGTLTVADSRSSHSQKNVYGQNFAVPLQPLNFALMPSTTASGSGSGNHGEKQQQAQQKSSKGAAELIPSQAFAMSFSSINGNNTASNLNFSSAAQNPTIFQSLPDMARQGYQVIPAPQSTQQKNHQLSEGKAASSLANPDDGKKAILGKSPANIGQTLVFDNSTRTLNFAPPPVTGSWASRSVTSTAMTMSAPMPANFPNSQQQLLQLHKQHVYQQQLQKQQPTGNRSKASTSNSLPASSLTAKFPNNASIYPQTVVQSNISAQTPQWKKNSTKIHSSQVSPASITASTMSTIKNLPQNQGRTSQGHPQISFGGNSKSVLTSQGQQIPPACQFPSPLTAGSPPSSGNSRTTSAGTKTNSTIPTQQTENSSTSNGQKSSPVCGRNVPSILSTCPSHLSELKY